MLYITQRRQRGIASLRHSRRHNRNRIGII